MPPYLPNLIKRHFDGYKVLPANGQEGEAKLGDDRNAGSTKENAGLKPQMTLINGCSVIVGSIIGSGIFVCPTGVLQNTGSVNLSLIVWLVSGIFSMVGAYCYAELGTMIRKSGADYAYIMDTFGPFLAFIRLWVECIIMRPCSQAIFALTFAKYATKPLFLECDPPGEAVILLAAMCICLLAFVNSWDVMWATRVQDVFTFAKLLVLTMIIITGIMQLMKGKTDNFTFDGTDTDFTTITLSFYSGLYAYSGWNSLNFIIEELQDPIRTLPKAIAISCTIVTSVYLLTIIAFHTILSVSEALGSETVAVSFGNKMYGDFSWIIPVFVAMSTFGGANGNLLTSSRLFYAGSVEGQLPQVLSMIQVNRNTPAPSVLFVSFLSLFYLCTSDVISLINYTGFGSWASIGLGVVCLPVLRWIHPEWERPIKVNLVFPLIYTLATIFILIVPIIASPIESFIGIGITFSGIPFYFIFMYWKNKPGAANSMLNKFTQNCQKLLIVHVTKHDING